jgi:MYXO-CTERM domain-containing protein
MQLRLSLIAAAASAAASLAAATAHAQLPAGYDHEIRGRTISVPSALPGFLFPDQTSISGRNPALSADGDVAITVAAVPGGGDTVQAIWVHRDGTGGIVYTGTVTPAFEAGFSDVLLTSAGRLYWSESPFGRTPRVMYLDPGGSATFITSGPLGTTRYDSLRVSESPDRLAALAQLGTGRALIGIENIPSPSFTVYLTDSGVDPSSPFTFLVPGIGLNRTPELAIEAWPAGLEAIQRVTAPGQTAQIVAVNQTIAGISVRGLANGSPINAAGQVAFIAFGQGGVEAVLRSEPDGRITVIATTAPGSQIDHVGNFPPVINDAGLVAFRGVGIDGQDAIYVGDGAGLVTVVRETDVVPTDLGLAQIGNETPGSNYTAFSGNIAINQRGDVAYVASVYPNGDRTVEWGSGVFVAVARLPPVEPPDAGVPDASIPDASIPDAGIPDASPVDAAAPDAAPPDATVPDAQLPPLADAAPGDPLDASPGDPFDASPGDPLDASPGDPLDASPGDPLDASPGDPPDATPGDPPDATPPEDPGTPGDGCGCTAGQASSGSTSLGTLILTLVVAVLLRRPRRLLPRRSARA